MNYNREAQYYNALNLAFGTQLPKLSDLFNYFESWEGAYLSLRGQIGVDARKEWDRLQVLGIEVIMAADQYFPLYLKEMPSPPFAVYIKGDKSIFNNEAIKIAIVGTRKASALGEKLAEEIARDLALQEIDIASGLALGIDQAAHWGCLAGNGRTIAVLPCGLDKVYPSQHIKLANKILENNGLLISEYPLGSLALQFHFLERNRLVSGLSRGVVVIEAPAKSGALVTAACALEQNRDVFVVPGSINNINYSGSNKLIKQGAALITSADDVLEAYNINRTDSEKLRLNFSRLNLSKEKEMILKCVGKESGLVIDKICYLTKLEPQTVNRNLSLLVIDGIIHEEGGKYYVKTDYC